MAPSGSRVRAIITTFQRDDPTCRNDSTSSSQVKEAEKDIQRSPIPKGAFRAVKPRLETTGQQQQEQTPPSSPHDEFHRQSQSPTPCPQSDRSPTPEKSPTSTELPPMDDPLLSRDDVEEQLSALKIKVQDLECKLKNREQAEISLRNSLNEANRKYDELIFDMQKSKREKDIAQDQVDRLQKQLREVTRDKEELLRELHSGMKRERELRELLRSQTSAEDFIEEVKMMLAAGKKTIRMKGVLKHVRATPSVEEQRERYGSERCGSQGMSGRNENRPPWNRDYSSRENKAERGSRSK